MTPLQIEFFLVRRGEPVEAQYPDERKLKHPHKYFHGGMSTIRAALETDDETRAEWLLTENLKAETAVERMGWRITRKTAIITR